MNRREQEILIQRLFDDEIEEGDFERLQEELIGNPELRKRFYGYASLHQALSFRRAGSDRRQGLGSLIRSAQQQRILRHTALLATAAVIILVVSLRLILSPAVPPTAAFRTSEGSVFTVTHNTGRTAEKPAPGALGVGSTLDLERGNAELTLACGVTGIVRGPATLAVRGDKRVFLARGSAWFQVEEKGRGFHVVTHELEITDLGTEFGVIASDDAPDEVHCFKGKVLARTLGPRVQEKPLVRNQAFQGDFIGRLHPVKLRPEEFLQSLPAGLTCLHWSFDGTEEGTFPSDGGHPAAGRACSRLAPSESAAMPAMVPGRFGQGLGFDGSHNDLLTDWPGILGDAPRSVAIWIKVPTDQESDADILSWGTRLPSSERFNLKFKLGLSRMEGLVPVVSFGGTRYYAVDAKVADNQWHHLACTYRGGPLGTEDIPVSLYVDGKPCALTFSDDTDSPDRDGRYRVNTLSQTPLAIGTAISNSGEPAVTDQYRFRGEMDELYIFEYPITGEAIDRLYTENHSP